MCLIFLGLKRAYTLVSIQEQSLVYFAIIHWCLLIPSLLLTQNEKYICQMSMKVLIQVFSKCQAVVAEASPILYLPCKHLWQIYFSYYAINDNYYNFTTHFFRKADRARTNSCWLTSLTVIPGIWERGTLLFTQSVHNYGFTICS